MKKKGFQQKNRLAKGNKKILKARYKNLEQKLLNLNLKARKMRIMKKNGFNLKMNVIKGDNKILKFRYKKKQLLNILSKV